MRRRFHPPPTVIEVVLRAPARWTGSAALAPIRRLLREAGYVNISIHQGFTGRRTVVGEAAIGVLAADEQRADREDYWWSGDVCWTTHRGFVIVAPESMHAATATLVAWGGDAIEVLAAIAKLIEPPS